MDKEKVLNLGLVFDGEIKSQLENYSQYLNGKLPGGYVLGTNSLPHISVLQCLADKTAEEIWPLVEKFAAQPWEVKFQGLYFDKGRTSGKIWFGVRIALTEELIALQQSLNEIVKPKHIVQGMGVKYFPHITLGGADPVEELPAISFEPKITMLEKVSCRLALGRSGPNLQFAEILYS